MQFAFSGLIVGQRYSRDDLTRLWGLGGRQAISRGVVTPANSEDVVLFVTETKSAGMTAYRDQLAGSLLKWEGDGVEHNIARIARQLDESSDTIWLFFRDRRNEDFIFCGRVTVEAADTAHPNGRFDLRLESASAQKVQEARHHQALPGMEPIDASLSCAKKGVSVGTLQEIRDSVEQIAQGESLKPDRAFGYWFLDDVLQLSREDALLTVTDGPWDGGRDAVYFDEGLGSLKIFQMKYTWTDLPYALSGLTDLQRGLEFEHEKLEHTSDLWLYLVTLVSLGPEEHAEVERVRQQAEEWLTAQGFDGISVVVEVFDLDRFTQLYERLKGVRLTLDYKVPPMAVDGAVIGLVDARAFKAVVDKEELLAFNIRQFLGLRKGSVNTEIFESLKDEKRRQEFWKLNNGLVCLCTDYQDFGNGRIGYSDLTVVNGAQTISTTARFLKENPLANGPIWVLSKIIRVQPEDIEAAVRLTKTSNTQNAANNKDLRAIDTAHGVLEKWFSDYLDVSYVYKRGQSAPYKREKLDMKDVAQAYIAFWDEQPEVAFSRSGTIYSSNDLYGAVFPGDEIEELKARGDEESIRTFLIHRYVPVVMLREIRDHINSRVAAGDDTKWRSLSFQMLWLYRVLLERSDNLDLNAVAASASDIVNDTVAEVYKNCQIAAGLLKLEVPRDLKTDRFTSELRSNPALESLFEGVKYRVVELGE